MKLTKFGILVNKTTSLSTSIRDSNISRGCVKILEISEGRGGVNFGGRFWKIQSGGGVIWQIPSVGVVWIFSGTTHFYKSTCSDWLIDLCVLPTGRMPWIILHLWEFLCVMDAGCRGNKVTVYVSKNDFSKLYKWYNSCCHGNWLMQFLNNVSTENEISTLRCDL